MALIAHSVVSTGYAACAITPESFETLVRGRFVRCEDARFHLEASGAYRIHQRDLEVRLARVGPQNRETLLERIGDALLTPDFEARVIVVAVDWHVPIVPWLRGVSETVEFKDEPRELRETVRYWWSGAIEACEGIAEASSIDLWAHSECCDTYEFASPVCIVSMRYAEPAPDVIGDAFSALLGER
jgi:hypothetical protein